jgi:AraC family transcriptional regulator
VWKQISRGERLNWHGHPVPYRKEPGTIFVYSEGLLPLVRPSTQTELIVCVLNRTFVREVGDELNGNHPDIHARTSGFRDTALNSLMRLFEEESKLGGSSGRLYVEHLTYALTVRLLSLGMKRESCHSSTNVLPAPRLHRVIERMKAGLPSDCDLKMLAMESGYSRNHFLRMFRGQLDTLPTNTFCACELTRPRR